MLRGAVSRSSPEVVELEELAARLRRRSSENDSLSCPVTGLTMSWPGDAMLTPSPEALLPPPHDGYGFPSSAVRSSVNRTLRVTTDTRSFSLRGVATSVGRTG